MNRTIYIAGPMTGIDDYNYPAFNRAADRLRAKGWVVINPAERNGIGRPYPDLIREGIAELLGCSHIYLLDGWTQSRGAMLEFQVACACGMMAITETGGRHT